MIQTIETIDATDNKVIAIRFYYTVPQRAGIFQSHGMTYFHARDYIRDYKEELIGLEVDSDKMEVKNERI